jgi:hypothetical protein
MFGDDMTVVVFLAALVVTWGGLLLCFRRVILGVKTAGGASDFLHADENEGRQLAPVTPGWAKLEIWTFLGMALAVAGYLVMCFVMIYWLTVLGVLMFLFGFIVVPAIALMRARRT